MLITKYLLDKGSAIREHTSNFLFRDDHFFWNFGGFQVSEASIKCSELETNDRIELHTISVNN